MPKAARFALAVFLFMASPLFASIFIVPEDAELAENSAGIIIGVVVGSTAQAGDEGIETVYDVRVERSIKGSFSRDSIVKVTSSGGQLESRFTLVPGSAHFAKDDKVLLFLMRHKGTWTPTSMTLGKFRFVTSTGGQSLLVRDAEDIVGFDKQMRTHVEKVRREKEFLRFLEETVRGQKPEQDYFVAPGEVVAIEEKKNGGFRAKTNDTFTPRSYSALFNPGNFPGRWPEARMSASIPKVFLRNTAHVASGLGDGGHQMLVDALNAWTSDCPSAVHITLGGTTTLPHDDDDNVNIVVWNDPGNHIPGTFPGNGIIAKAFMNGDNLVPFNGDPNWVTISDTDVVVETGVTGAESFMATAMTHELGHAIGLRHSNQHGDQTACQAGDECTSSAVMNSSVTTNWNFTLQQWDKNAILAIYPGNTCGTPPPPPIDVSAWTTNGSSVTISWLAAQDATSYKVFRRSSTAASYSEIASGILASPYVDNTVVSGTSYQYVVRSTNASGDSANSDADFSTAFNFTDGPLVVAGVTTIKLVHFTELTAAINALRTLGGLAPFTFTGGAPALGSAIKASHLEDMHVAIDQAYTSVGAGGLNFDPVSGPVLAYHMNSMRSLTR